MVLQIKIKHKISGRAYEVSWDLLQHLPSAPLHGPRAPMVLQMLQAPPPGLHTGAPFARRCLAPTTIPQAHHAHTYTQELPSFLALYCFKFGILCVIVLVSLLCVSEGFAVSLLSS